MDSEQLSKKERKELKKEQEHERFQREKQKRNLIKWGSIGIVVFAFVVFGWWILQQSNQPLPGKDTEDQGRAHISEDQWKKYTYKSNPPTSGSHDPQWLTPSIYSEPQGVGHAVHSLEHGYIIINYNCATDKTKNAPNTYTESKDFVPMTGSEWSSTECKNLIKQLTDVANGQRLWKLIVMPWPAMKYKIALTAWTRIETLDSFNKDQIVSFIAAFRDHGPEQTME